MILPGLSKCPYKPVLAKKTSKKIFLQTIEILHLGVDLITGHL
jgi:hypothetical protein